MDYMKDRIRQLLLYKEMQFK